MWLSETDPVTSMAALRKSAPALAALRAVVAQWCAVIGGDRVTVSDVAGRALDMSSDTFKHPDFRDALMAVCGKGGMLDNRRLGEWLSKNQGRIVDGFCFVRMDYRQGVAVWALKRNA
jgi:hypothetical protein